MGTRLNCLLLFAATALACNPVADSTGDSTGDAAADSAAGSAAAKPESVDDRVSYAIGLNVGQGVARDGIDVDLDYVLQGMRDGIAGTDPLLTPEEIKATMQEMQQVLDSRRAAAGVEAKETGAAFLAENAARPEVTTTASGLQYEVLTPGDGARPSDGDTVSVHYQGTLLDGTVFDSSYRRNQPATFPLSGVIPGWKEGLQLMPVGSKYKLYVPSELAYGEQGTPGGPIPPNSALIFEVELLEIK